MESIKYDCGCIIKAEVICPEAKGIIERLRRAYSKHKDDEFEEIVKEYYAHYHQDKFIKVS